MGKVWPEVLQEMKKVGILDMEIYIHGNTLFMIMEAVEDFDHEQAFKSWPDNRGKPNGSGICRSSRGHPSILKQMKNGN
jgi:steroid 5-alpha reductase family enzyme